MSIVRVDNKNQNFSLTPKTLDEAMQYAKIIAESDFCPRESKGKAGNVLIAIQYGAELGLSPMQALQNISVINGRPCLWGDALLGLVKAHPSFVDIHEEIKNDVAYCRVIRKNCEPVEVTFGIEDAKKANLWGKQGPWTQYPKRMLQMRARGFALRDAFADALKGLITREEVEDYEVKSYKNKKFNEPINTEIIESQAVSEGNILIAQAVSEINQDDIDQSQMDFSSWKFWIEAASSLDALQKTYDELKASDMKKTDPVSYKELILLITGLKSKMIKAGENNE
jgi:hypothetical protein